MLNAHYYMAPSRYAFALRLLVAPVPMLIAHLGSFSTDVLSPSRDGPTGRDSVTPSVYVLHSVIEGICISQHMSWFALGSNIRY